MELSSAEKMILIMLSDLHKKLDVAGDIDPDFLKSAIDSGNLWGVEWKYPGLFEIGSQTPDVVREVCDFLEMWGCLERSWSKLSAVEKAEVIRNAEPFGNNVKFIGFDGNHEGEYVSVARFLTEDLDRFSDFKGRVDLNAHSHTLGTHRRMSGAFKRIRPFLSSHIMDATQVTELLKG